jgi:hypothetical protein
VAGSGSLASQGGNPSGCGIPLGPATAVIINFAAVTPTGSGNLRAWAVADPQPPAPTAAVMNFSTALPALANGVAVPICDPAATSCAAGDLRLQADVSSVHVVGDVVGYFSRPTNRAYAMVSGTSFVAAATKNFVSVTRPSTGVYCLTPAAGIANAQPAVVTVEWGLSSGFDLLAYNWGFGANGQSGSPCAAGQFHVRTYQFGANPASPALSNNVAFQIFVP